MVWGWSQTDVKAQYLQTSYAVVIVQPLQMAYAFSLTAAVRISALKMVYKMCFQITLGPQGIHLPLQLFRRMLHLTLAVKLQEFFVDNKT